jgi:hypothetical protein
MTSPIEGSRTPRAEGIKQWRTVIAGVSSKSFGTPDEKRTPDKTNMEVLRLSGATVARITFQPVGFEFESAETYARG